MPTSDGPTSPQLLGRSSKAIAADAVQALLPAVRDRMGSRRGRGRRGPARRRPAPDRRRRRARRRPATTPRSPAAGAAGRGKIEQHGPVVLAADRDRSRRPRERVADVAVVQHAGRERLDAAEGRVERGSAKPGRMGRSPRDHVGPQLAVDQQQRRPPRPAARRRPRRGRSRRSRPRSRRQVSTRVNRRSAIASCQTQVRPTATQTAPATMAPTSQSAARRPAFIETRRRRRRPAAAPGRPVAGSPSPPEPKQLQRSRAPPVATAMLQPPERGGEGQFISSSVAATSDGRRRSP